MDLKGHQTSSQDLLSCGTGAGLSEKLLLKPKVLQTERVPRSSVLQRLTSFLPKMADANQKLKQQMDEAPAGRFDIEDVEEAEKVIEMDVALFQLSGSEHSSEDDVEASDSEDDKSEITEQNLKLPGAQGQKRRADIQVLEHPGPDRGSGHPGPGASRS